MVPSAASSRLYRSGREVLPASTGSGDAKPGTAAPKTAGNAEQGRSRRQFGRCERLAFLRPEGGRMIPYWPVLLVLARLPLCHRDPPTFERLSVIAAAIATVSDTTDDAAALLTIGQHESAWCLDVHDGRARGWGAMGLWQIERGSRRVPPFFGTSLDDTTHAAGEALWLWRHSWQCGRSAAARFRAYGSAPCGSSWPGAESRARMFATLSWRLASQR